MRLFALMDSLSPSRWSVPGRLRHDQLHPGDGSSLHGGAGFGAALPVPWQRGGMMAAQQDFDHDGIPDAFDDYFGPGAHAPGS